MFATTKKKQTNKQNENSVIFSVFFVCALFNGFVVFSELWEFLCLFVNDGLFVCQKI